MWIIFKILYGICFNIASVLCGGFLFAFLMMRHVKSYFPDQGWNPHPAREVLLLLFSYFH